MWTATKISFLLIVLIISAGTVFLYNSELPAPTKAVERIIAVPPLQK